MRGWLRDKCYIAASSETNVQYVCCCVDIWIVVVRGGERALGLEGRNPNGSRLGNVTTSLPLKAFATEMLSSSTKLWETS